MAQRRREVRRRGEIAHPLFLFLFSLRLCESAPLRQVVGHRGVETVEICSAKKAGDRRSKTGYTNSLARLHQPLRFLAPSTMMRVALQVLIFTVTSAVALGAETPEDREGIELFEKKIRPVLVERCYECHSSKAKQLEGSLSLETRSGLLKGGDQGAAVVPGQPEKSLLLKAIRYTDSDLQMPPKPGERLAAEVVANFEAWIKRGAPDPRGQEPVASGQGSGGVDIEAAKRQ